MSDESVPETVLVSVEQQEMSAPQDSFASTNEDAYTLVADVLGKVREELDDHREAINENTNEITLNQEFLNSLSSRIDTLTSRIDELTLLVKCGSQPAKQEWQIAPLTDREKEVFHALYVVSEERNNAATYKELAQKLGASEASVSAFVTSFVAKGIPIVKKYANGRAYVGLDVQFRHAQAKNNIVGINTLLTYWQR